MLTMAVWTFGVCLYLSLFCTSRLWSIGFIFFSLFFSFVVLEIYIEYYKRGTQ